MKKVNNFQEFKTIIIIVKKLKMEWALIPQIRLHPQLLVSNLPHKIKKENLFKKQKKNKMIKVKLGVIDHMKQRREQEDRKVNITIIDSILNVSIFVCV